MLMRHLAIIAIALFTTCGKEAANPQADTFYYR
jgi:hypothetical protein